MYRCKQCGKTEAVEDVLSESLLHGLPPYGRLSKTGDLLMEIQMTRTHNCLGQAYGIAELIGLRVLFLGEES